MMGAPEWGSLLITLAGFFALGHLINHLGGSIYWWWADWRAAKEDEKMLKDQEKSAEKPPDNVVKLDEIRNKIITSNYDDETIH
tara:strand:- start:357 stop:608 length:252 start_codon:yes stop_codon:yes gene_type:complete